MSILKVWEPTPVLEEQSLREQYNLRVEVRDQTDNQTDLKTDTKSDRKVDTQTDRQTPHPEHVHTRTCQSSSLLDVHSLTLFTQSSRHTGVDEGGGAVGLGAAGIFVEQGPRQVDGREVDLSSRRTGAALLARQRVTTAGNGRACAQHVGVEVGVALASADSSHRPLHAQSMSAKVSVWDDDSGLETLEGGVGWVKGEKILRYQQVSKSKPRFRFRCVLGCRC